MAGNFYIIDDNPIDLLVSSKMVQRTFGGQVKTLNGGSEAIDYFKSETVKDNSIILLDVKMPEMDGFEFLTCFEPFVANAKDIRIFMLSSTLDRYDLDRAAKHKRVTKLLNKPLDTEELKGLL